MRMPEFGGDQADGLRRLLARSPARVATVVGARSGLGATSVVVNLAACWARSGKDVLVLDEHLSPDNVANTLGLKPRYDLLNVVRGDKALHEVILRDASGVLVLPAARAIQALPKLERAELDRLSQVLSFAASGMDAVLVDAAAREGHSVCTSLSGDEPLMMVLNATASGITESYAMLKQMVIENGRESFEIVVNKAANPHEARAVFDNMAQVASRHLRIQLNYAGYIPVDEKLHRATQLRRPVVEQHPGGAASRCFDDLARELWASREVHGSGQGLAGMMQRLARQTGLMHAVN